MSVMANSIIQTDFNFAGQNSVYHGKVRDTYTINNNLLVAIATDRISAFDVILPKPIPFKGQVLNQIATHFLNATKDIATNWLLSTPDPNVSIGTLCEPFKIEMVIRGCLVGHSWRQYNAGERILCGETMPEGMQQYDQFPEPLITPATKADEGHDEDISHVEIVKRGLATQEEFDELCQLTKALFKRGQEMAAERGLYLADTKYEFGKKDGKIYLIDEIHTPDSSRYFYQEGLRTYLEDRNQPEPQHLSKEFVREWLLENDFSGQEGQMIPEMTEEFVDQISTRYIELFEKITGQTFQPADSTDILDRIEKNVTKELQKL